MQNHTRGHTGKMLLLLLAVATACSDGTGPPEPPAPGHGVRAELIASGYDFPLHLTAPPGDDRLFVVEQAGRIRIIEDDVIQLGSFLDISSKVAFGGERGLLSVAFDPQYAETGHFWVNYTELAGNTRVERYTVSADPDVADPTSARLVLEVDQPAVNHNGGHIAFGPDEMLYIAMGDGGGCCDEYENSQNLTTLLGALLRIDVRSAAPYTIPPDNPYVGNTNARPEIWASGLRNPWRVSFDSSRGHLFLADVGQGVWEEINAVAHDAAGLNYGWPVMEASECFNASSCDQDGLTLPVHEYSHQDGCSVIGGHVYRGSLLLDLQGHYVYSDFCGGWLRSFRLEGGSATDHGEWDIGEIPLVTSVSRDAAGELYVVSSSGSIYRLLPEE